MPIAEEVSPDLLWKHLETICQWERYTGTAGENEAVAYIERGLSELGIDVTVHEFDALISLPGKTVLEIEGDGPNRIDRIDAITAAFGASTPEMGVSGVAVHVGEGGPGGGITGDTSQGGGAEASYGPVAGRVVVAEGMVSPGRFYHFERQGAIAQVYVNKGVAHELTVSTIWGSPTPESIGRMATTPIVTLSREQGQGLIDLLKTKREVRLRVHAQVDTRWRTTRMPVATVVPEKAEGDYILVGGHIDSWQFGANDNGAGDATLMELARLLHANRGDIRRGLKVAWWNGHSHGRFSGSTWYADHMFGELRAHCAAYLNIDQPGCRQCTLYRPFSTAEISGWVQDAVARIGGQKTKPDHPKKMADQSLWGVGIPSFSFLPVLPPDAPDLQKDHPEGGFPEYWHNPADTLDKMDKSLLAEHCRLYAGALLELCALERLPFDPRAQAAVVEEEIAALDRRAGGAFDLGPVREAAARFTEAARAMAGRLASADAAEANRALRRVSHALNPALYTQSGPFDHDPASGASRLPGLQRVDAYLAAGPATHEGRVLYTRLVRERNRVTTALEEAGEAARAI